MSEGLYQERASLITPNTTPQESDHSRFGKQHQGLS